MKASDYSKPLIYIALYYSIAIVLRYFILFVRPEFIKELPVFVVGLLTGVGPLIGGLVLVLGFKRKNNLRLFSIGIWETIVLVMLPVVLFVVLDLFNSGNNSLSILSTLGFAFVYALFEEYGWRGYLQTELGRLKAIYRYLVVGVLWYFWHLDIGFEMQHLWAFVYVFAGSLGMGYVADRSKSLVLPTLFHMLFNVLFSNEMGPFTMAQKVSVLVISTASIILIMRIKLRKGTS